ncbi:MAG: Asp-tRNA(Asn)/Glu-tRNA(Gln) amidotransferase subunit GatA [Chloroflexi bacterium]|nr:Asp-tRNA(Asn)/Glu-tRNA(Gln) amidotransferase subunit GatA [Chloroflexota bacterium]
MKLYELTIHEALDLLRRREISAVELTQAVLDRIVDVDNDIKAYITLLPETALEEARLADKRRHAGMDGLLLGIPLAIKDVICLAGAPTTCGSRILEPFIPPYDATVIERLRQAGAVFLGKTNTDEFAMGSSTENSAFFTTHNPWDLSRVPGGSSGGSAAAVSADETLAALGSDTGGSVRQPASLCGVVGLKPTYGRVSRYGLVAFASSLDQIGPLSKDVTDCALLLNVIAGHDVRDSTSLNMPVPDYTQALRPEIKGLRIGVPREYFATGIQPGVEASVRQAIQVLADLGAEISETSLPHTEYALPTYYLIAPAEASANLARYDGVKYGYAAPDASDIWEAYRKTRQYGFGAEVKRRIMLGTYALSAGYYDAYYLKAQKVRTLIKQDFDRAFQQFDVLVGPTSPTVAFKIGEKIEDPLQMYLSDVFTLAHNLAGICALSLPCGFADGLPVGLQISGPALGEEIILRVAYTYEQATQWHTYKPAIKSISESSPQKSEEYRL